MTRRERMERRLEKRREWADKASTKAQSACDTASQISMRFEMGQPILVGHHSEAKARRDQSRMDSCMRSACENTDKAKTHENKADNIEAALERTVFSDDDDAIEKLEARIKEREAEAEHCKFVNARYKKTTKALNTVDCAKVLAELVRLGNIPASDAMQIAKKMGLCPYERAPYPGYHLTNLRASIRRDQQRIEEIKRQQESIARADAAGGVDINDVGNGAVLVTFAEKPDRGVLDALKEAGFCWSRGSWYGQKEKLPTCVVGSADAV